MTQSITPTLSEVCAAEEEYRRALDAFGADCQQTYEAERCWRRLKALHIERRQTLVRDFGV